MKKKAWNYCLTIMGLLWLGAGLYLARTIIAPQGVMRALPYVFIGVGCGIFGQGMGEIIGNRAIKNKPDIKKHMEIEKNDERNITIANRAKAKAYDMMVFVFGALMLAYALMGIDMVEVLLLVFAYLFVIGYGIYYRFKFDKEM
jgi:hypothetical protein